MSMSLNPYLIFDGKTREAVNFYEKTLDGKVMGIMTFGDMPADPDQPLSDDMKERVMHAHLKVGDSDLMFSDTFAGMPHQQGDTIQIAIHPKQEEKARAIFDALEDGGEVVMPLQKTDWSPLYGIVKDKFGVTFQINVPEDQS
ncbi:VOC family protein [Halobacillus sp. A5]|uniref:VOC family protein n=1 Tax=Halobacillus sp. A5 TaxID=2880263 RepID=UPI0020A6C449|nr:VOC family protein [Halobacillus sp. A5]MCP3028593.1 VOC family protein [Halobacillus sp. A5]